MDCNVGVAWCHVRCVQLAPPFKRASMKIESQSCSSENPLPQSLFQHVQPCMPSFVDPRMRSTGKLKPSRPRLIAIAPTDRMVAVHCNCNFLALTTAISSLRRPGSQDRGETFLRVPIRQIGAWICCIARRDQCHDRQIRVGVTATLRAFLCLSARWHFRSIHGRLHSNNLFAVSAAGCCVVRNLTTSSFWGKETNSFGSKSVIDSSVPFSNKRLLVLCFTFKSMPKVSFWQCRSCRGQSRKRCQHSTSVPITTSLRSPKVRAVIAPANG